MLRAQPLDPPREPRILFDELRIETGALFVPKMAHQPRNDDMKPRAHVAEPYVGGRPRRLSEQPLEHPQMMGDLLVLEGQPARRSVLLGVSRRLAVVHERLPCSAHAARLELDHGAPRLRIGSSSAERMASTAHARLGLMIDLAAVARHASRAIRARRRFMGVMALRAIAMAGDAMETDERRVAGSAGRRSGDTAGTVRAMAAGTALFDATMCALRRARVAVLALRVSADRACVRLVTSSALRMTLERGRRLRVVACRATRRRALRL